MHCNFVFTLTGFLINSVPRVFAMNENNPKWKTISYQHWQRLLNYTVMYCVSFQNLKVNEVYEVLFSLQEEKVTASSNRWRLGKRSRIDGGLALKYTLHRINFLAYVVPTHFVFDPSFPIKCWIMQALTTRLSSFSIACWCPSLNWVSWKGKVAWIDKHLILTTFDFERLSQWTQMKNTQMKDD